MITPIFSNFYWKRAMFEDHRYLYNMYVDKMEENYRNQPLISPDWNVHTSYDVEHLLKNKIDWNPALKVYEPYVNQFLSEYLGTVHKWNHNGVWYTAYGRGQTANTHEHVPSTFSVVHYIKFNPDIHWPITFVHPQTELIKYILKDKPLLKNNLNFNNPEQSLFHPRFTPKIKEGDLVIFPGHLEHLVEKSDSDDIRITIAFNIELV